MKLSFDKPATRKIELWATSRGIDIDDIEAISQEILIVVCAELDGLRPTQPEKGGGSVQGV